jgi:twitching motility protein PilT
MAKIDSFFNLMFEQKASDLHLSAGNHPMLRINGELQRVEHPPLANDELKSMLYEIAPEYKIKIFEEMGDVDFGYEIPNISRFRAKFPARCSRLRILKNSMPHCRRCSKNSPCSTRAW